MLKIVSGSNFLEITGLAMTPWLCDSVQVLLQFRSEIFY